MSYSAEVLADSPLAYYRLGEESGSTVMVDSSGNGRSGTYGTAALLGAAGLLLGDSDTCMEATSFGANPASVASSAWLDQTKFTVEAWVTLDSFAGTRTIVARYNGTTAAGMMFSLRLDAGVLRFYRGGAGFLLVAGPTLSLGTVYHVAATYDGTTARLYVNGSMVGSAAQAAHNLPAQPLSIGSNAGGVTERLFGRIDEVSFYGTALSGPRIAAHYAAGTTAGPVASQLTLNATAPAATAALGLSHTLPTRTVTLVGAAPAATAAFALEHAEPAPVVSEVTLSAVAPAATAVVDIKHIAPAVLTFTATAPTATAAVDLTHIPPALVTFAATSPPATASFLLDTPTGEPTITFAAIAPAATARLNLFSGAIEASTDLRNRANGRNRTGSGENATLLPVAVAPTTTEPIRIMSQQMPTPKLRKGRPT